LSESTPWNDKEIEPLTGAQVDAAVAVSVRAFQDDPLGRYLFPSPDRRQVGLELYLGPFVRYGCRTRQAFTTSGGVRGAAVWALKGSNSISAVEMVSSGFVAAQFRFQPAEHLRMMKVGLMMNLLYTRSCRADAFALQVLAVDPPHQGNGLGSRLLQPVLQQADTRRRACALLTTSERAVGFYQRLGFQVAGTRRLPEGDLQVWAMQREPRATG
jgi:ribosomal protein S18 acetylase RimI-like enzyme